MTEALNIAFKDSLSESIGVSNAALAFNAFEAPASVSVRMNPLKRDALSPGRMLGLTDVASTASVPWCEYGYFLESRPVFTLDPLFHSGAYYVQDSSAMFVGHIFRKHLTQKDRPLRVLDLCAAPGGKTTDLTTSLRQFCGENFVLVANEVMRQRSGILTDNVGKWGDPNVVVTSVDPRAFASLEGFFDIIVADVPCSGEGMFRKDEEAIRQWSEDNVALCEARQRRIVGDVWPALSEGGVLLYSTCTFNKKENDGNVAWICNNLGADSIALGNDMPGVFATEYGFSLVPGLVRGEGQYCAAVRKTTGSQFSLKPHKAPKSKVSGNLFSIDMDIVDKNGMEIAVPSRIWSEVETLEILHPLVKGVAIGAFKGRDLVPHADLALSNFLSQSAFEVVEINKQDALAFLHKDSLALHEAPRGLLVLKYENYNLGFVKNLGNRCNNLLPQGRRIRMDI